MTKSELDERLLPLTVTEGVGATVYFIMQTEDGLDAKRADIDDTIQPEIRNQFVESLRTGILDNEELAILSLSSADERTNAIYQYDLEEVPAGLELIDTILTNDNLDDFSFEQDDLASVKALVVLIGNDEHQIAIYKKSYPVSVMKRESVLAIIKSETRFTKLESDVLKINDTVDFFKIASELYIMNLAALERFFGFHNIIERRAKEGIATIEAADILDNPEVLEELLSEVSFARKLVKVTSDSPVLGDGVPNSEVIAFTKTHPALAGRFQYNQDETKIRLHTKQSKQLFLKLLNDDYLKSELTRRMYDSIAKDEVAANGSE
ncbi:MAG: anti-phage protein KwaB [Candidatus Zixiibacteriota bacterium]